MLMKNNYSIKKETLTMVYVVRNFNIMYEEIHSHFSWTIKLYYINELIN
jgi:hypothetical protein